MTTYQVSAPPQRGHEFWTRVGKWLSEDYSIKRGVVFGIILAAALVAFEIFNFSTTEFALLDLLGEARFIGLRWATILAIAFCGIDFAGLSRLFTPERANEESLEVWYLLGAWFLGATMNAMMTWWAVSLAMLDHTVGNEVLTRDELLTYVPIFVAILVWLTRIMIIGTFSIAGGRLFERARQVVREAQASVARQTRQQTARPTTAKRPAHMIGQQAAAKRELEYEDVDDDGFFRPNAQPQNRAAVAAQAARARRPNGQHRNF